MTVTLPIHVADQAVIDTAIEVFSRRLRAIGITNFTVDTGDAMQFAMLVPLTLDAALVDAVLKRDGVFELVPWPANTDAPAIGDVVPDTIEPIVSAGEFKSAIATTDSMGEPALKITLGPDGAAAFAIYTTTHINGVAPLLMDGVILTAPYIQSPIEGGDLLITGPDGIPIPTAAIVAIINSGPLPDAWSAQR